MLNQILIEVYYFFKTSSKYLLQFGTYDQMVPKVIEVNYILLWWLIYGLNGNRQVFNRHVSLVYEKDSNYELKSKTGMA